MLDTNNVNSSLCRFGSKANKSYRHRRLRLEILESRQLMASDVGFASTVTYRHDFDVNQNGAVEYLDALWIANRQTTQSIPGSSVVSNVDRVFYSSADFANIVEFINGQNELAKGASQIQSAGGGIVSNSALAPTAQAKGGNTKTPYDYWRVGSSSDDTAPAISGGLGLMGGGTDVDSLFKWMGGKAMGSTIGGGDFLVIRATGTDAYNPYIQSLVPNLNSVATLLIPDAAAAADPRVKQIIENAEAIFIAGGDQANYAKYWNDTGVEEAIYDAMQRNVSIGGTSAGLAVLGDFDYTAFTGKSTVSNDALLNPYDRSITIDGTLGDGFLTAREIPASPPSPAFVLMNLLKDTITDSHFRQRDRMGRLITFMSRLDADGLVQGTTVTPGKVRGIGINEQTALLVEPSGMATVVGNNPISGATNEPRSVYVMQHSTVGRRQLTSPLTYVGVSVLRADLGGAFDLLSPPTSIAHAESYSVSATGRLLTRNIAELTSTSLDGIYGHDNTSIA